MSINLNAARALAAAARDDTTAGLEARERLADLVDQLCAELEAHGEPHFEWAVQCQLKGGVHTDYRDDEDDARGFINSVIDSVYLDARGRWWLARRQRWSRVGEWERVGGDVEAEAGDE